MGPRQRIVGYIGTIDERFVRVDLHRRIFYRDATARLQVIVRGRREYERLSKLLEAKLEAVGAQLERGVSMAEPSPEQTPSSVAISRGNEVPRGISVEPGR